MTEPLVPQNIIEPHHAIGIIGRKHYGKTEVVKSLWRDVYSNFADRTIIICSKHMYDYDNANMADPNDILEEWDDDFMDNVMKDQVKKIKQGKAKQIVVIIDDCLLNVRSKTFRRLMLNHKCCRITPIVVMDIAMTMPPPIRTQFDFVFAAYSCIDEEMKYLHEKYFSMFRTYDDFVKIFEDNTKKYSMLVVHSKFPEPVLYSYNAH
jgi:hypothetical protein